MRYSRQRWVIVGLLFLATVINYMDRQIMSILSPTLRHELHLSEGDYANCVSAFLLSYSVMYAFSGRVIDWLDVKLGASLCVVWWSIATALTSLARGAGSLAIFRFLLGLGEPGIYPAGMKACGMWFPRKLRGTAMGLFSSGSSIGAIIAAPLVVWLTTRYSWRAAFVIPGIVGLTVWLPLWLLNYRLPTETNITPTEQAALQADTNAGERQSWWALLRERKVWAFVLGRVAADPVWYLYLFWLPDYFQRVRHMSLVEVGIYGWIPFLFADFGSVFGGMASDWLIRRNWTAPRARFAVLVAIAALAPLGALVGLVNSTALAITITCLIAFLCQAWSTNMATLVPDLMPKSESASAFGLMGTAGSIGGIVFAQVLGFSIAEFGYSSAFIMAATLHPLSLFLLYVLLRPALRAPKTKLELQRG